MVPPALCFPLPMLALFVRVTRRAPARLRPVRPCAPRGVRGARQAVSADCRLSIRAGHSGARQSTQTAGKSNNDIEELTNHMGGQHQKLERRGGRLEQARTARSQLCRDGFLVRLELREIRFAQLMSHLH